MLAAHDFDCEVEEFSSSDEQDFQSVHSPCGNGTKYADSEAPATRHTTSAVRFALGRMY